MTRWHPLVAAGLVLMFALAACSSGSTSEAARPVLKLRHSVLPTLDVRWERAHLVGGRDRLIVAVVARYDAEHLGTYRIHQFDPARWRWVRRPDASGIPQVVPGGLVTAYLRCGPPRGELGNQRCDVMVARLPDGATRWTARKVSKRREWVHEVFGVDPMGVAGDEAVFSAYRSTSIQLAVGLRSIRRLPIAPILEGPGIHGAYLRHDVQFQCIVDRHWFLIRGDGGATNGLGPGVAWIGSLDLRDRSSLWSKPVRVVVPGGADSPTSYGCWRSGPVAFNTPQTYELHRNRWEVLLPSGAPGVVDGIPPQLATAAVPVVFASGKTPVDPFAPVELWFLRTAGWEPVPGDVTLKWLYPGPNLVQLGAEVIGLVDAPSGPELRVLRPDPDQRVTSRR